jgi:hypothetical protein
MGVASRFALAQILSSRCTNCAWVNTGEVDVAAALGVVVVAAAVVVRPAAIAAVATIGTRMRTSDGLPTVDSMISPLPRTSVAAGAP